MFNMARRVFLVYYQNCMVSNQHLHVAYTNEIHDTTISVPDLNHSMQAKCIMIFTEPVSNIPVAILNPCDSVHDKD